ncbi:YcjF family protein [Bacillus marinisedimentorum]|uniref:YcjF family protein n=1 Tax=Bacillus marinisedimentorum TaxID=1821260 RepID=UPI0007E067B5|nr:DUF697 domain-containing protein [Bacillus marinisedimentorum]
MTAREESIVDSLKKRLTDEFFKIEKNDNLTPDQKADKIIFTTSALCAGIALQPIPFADMAILTPIQIFMAKKLGDVRGLPMTKEKAAEIVKVVGGVIGLGFAAQQTAIGLYKIGLPGLGGFMSVPLVAGLTYGIGKAVDTYMIITKQGRTPTADEIKKVFRQSKKEGKKIKPKLLSGSEGQADENK